MPDYKIYAEEERYAENEIPHQSLHLVATAELRNVGPDDVARGFMNDFRDLVASRLEFLVSNWQ